MATEASILVSPAGYLAHLPPPWRNVGEKGGAEGMGGSGLRKKLMEKGKRRMRAGYVNEPKNLDSDCLDSMIKYF